MVVVLQCIDEVVMGAFPATFCIVIFGNMRLTSIDDFGFDSVYHMDFS